jgi:hypothetical protein
VPIYLRIAYDLALGRAVDPQAVRNIAAFTASAHRAPIPQTRGMFLRYSLLAAAARGNVKGSDVASGQQLQQRMNLVHGDQTAWSPAPPKTFEPRGVDESDSRIFIDLITKAVVLAGNVTAFRSLAANTLPMGKTFRCKVGAAKGVGLVRVARSVPLGQG